MTSRRLHKNPARRLKLSARSRTLSRRDRGFTIVETLIFLAVSGAMLTSIVIMFNGVQARQQFAQGMRDVESLFQDVFNDVSTGYFDPIAGYRCTANGSGPPNFIAAADAEQGSNQGCIFLGKAIQLAPSESEGGGADKIFVHTVVGNRTVANGRDVTSFTQSRPTTVYGTTGSPDTTAVRTLRYGVRVKSARRGEAASSPPTYLGGIYGSFASFTPGSGSNGTSLESGNQNIHYYAHGVLGSPNQTKAQVKSCLQTGCFGGNTPSTEPWVICFEDANGRETAKLIVTAESLSTRLEFINCD